jgi:hypothetical protein
MGSGLSYCKGFIPACQVYAAEAVIEPSDTRSSTSMQLSTCLFWLKVGSSLRCDMAQSGNCGKFEKIWSFSKLINANDLMWYLKLDQQVGRRAGGESGIRTHGTR